MGGSELLDSGTRLREGVPNVCANEGSDWAEWADMSLCVLVKDMEEGAGAVSGSKWFGEACSRHWVVDKESPWPAAGVRRRAARRRAGVAGGAEQRGRDQRERAAETQRSGRRQLYKVPRFCELCLIRKASEATLAVSTPWAEGDGKHPSLRGFIWRQRPAWILEVEV